MILGDIHVLPVNDAREHDEHRSCWCRPRVEHQVTTRPDAYGLHDVPAVVVHHALDGREYWEPGHVPTEPVQ